MSLITPDTKIKSVPLADPRTRLLTFEGTRVSSMLDRTVGKKNLTDGNPETCWTSQQGLPQFVQLVFPRAVFPRRIVLTFQGGFVGIRCGVEVAVSRVDPVWTTWTHVHPKDVNRRQIFELAGEGMQDGIQCMRLVFEQSSDFFGRITIYELDVQGKDLVN